MALKTEWHENAAYFYDSAFHPECLFHQTKAETVELEALAYIASLAFFTMMQITSD